MLKRKGLRTKLTHLHKFYLISFILLGQDLNNYLNNLGIAQSSIKFQPLKIMKFKISPSVTELCYGMNITKHNIELNAFQIEN